MNKEELVAFEEEITELFLQKKIRAPIHLSRGNEEELIKIFRDVKRDDWVCSTHRSHYHALLHGIDPAWLKQEILDGRSIHIIKGDCRFLSSSIVAGVVPIAVGIAMGIKMKGEKRHVWVFVGDMAAETGAFYEATKYAARQGLPITFIVEDNGLSTNTPTQEVWGQSKGKPDIIKYSYIRGCEHVGVGQWVHF